MTINSPDRGDSKRVNPSELKPQAQTLGQAYITVLKLCGAKKRQLPILSLGPSTRWYDIDTAAAVSCCVPLKQSSALPWVQLWDRRVRWWCRNCCTAEHSCTTHVPTATGPTKAEKLKRLCISASGTSEEWAYFITRWREYRDGTMLKGREVFLQLLECCDEYLRKDLTRAAGGSLTTRSEEAVLTAMKVLAVRRENLMVPRVTLYNMSQDRNEPIRSFAARIKGQVGTCQYITKCSADACGVDVDFTEAILRDVLARGIADQEIQLDLLGIKTRTWHWKRWYHSSRQMSQGSDRPPDC